MCSVVSVLSLHDKANSAGVALKRYTVFISRAARSLRSTHRQMSNACQLTVFSGGIRAALFPPVARKGQMSSVWPGDAVRAQPHSVGSAPLLTPPQFGFPAAVISLEQARHEDNNAFDGWNPS